MADNADACSKPRTRDAWPSTALARHSTRGERLVFNPLVVIIASFLFDNVYNNLGVTARQVDF
jgi:hypothetical protein